MLVIGSSKNYFVKKYFIANSVILKDLTQTAVSQRVNGRKLKGISAEKSNMVSGGKLMMIKILLWLDVVRMAVLKEKNIFEAIKKIRRLYRLKQQYRLEKRLLKYARINKQYYFSYNAPGWPSKAFDRYISHQLTRLNDHQISLHTLILGITTKCGFACEHCYEWKNLNTPESLSHKDLYEIIQRFRNLGVSMVQITGGEPLNRIKDLISLIPCFPEIEFCMYTSGYKLSADKAKQLSIAGLKSVTISLDHWSPGLHDRFRGRQGAFDWVVVAAKNVVHSNMLLCLSLCATNDFISNYNLYQYFELAKSLGASFIQILEPKAVGHYDGLPVSLDDNKIRLLEEFYEDGNFNPVYVDYPRVIYHGFYGRRMGCSGAGKDYLYVDMTGYAHKCPFSEKKLFNVLSDGLETSIEKMKKSGCHTLHGCS